MDDQDLLYTFKVPTPTREEFNELKSKMDATVARINKMDDHIDRLFRITSNLVESCGLLSNAIDAIEKKLPKLQ